MSAHFLSFSRASNQEAITRLQDGIDRGYFTPEACQLAFKLADQSGRLTTALQTYLRRRRRGG